MKNALRSVIIFLFVLTVSQPGLAQEFPFTFFPDKAGVLKEVLAFQQNKNKEILFVNHEGVYSFNSRYIKKDISFSGFEAGSVREALFTSSDQVIILSGDSLFSIDLKTRQKERLKKGLVEKVFYRPEEDILFVSTPTSLEQVNGAGESTKVLDGVKNIQSLLFGKGEYFIIEKENIRVYNTAWSLKERINVREPIIDSYLNDEKLWVLTATGIFSRELGVKGLKKYQSLDNEVPSCILEDRTGNVWVGTENNGLILFDGSRRKNLGRDNNFGLRKVKGIMESNDFSLWFYGEGGMVFKPFSAPFQVFRLGQHLPGTVVKDIKEAGPDKVAILTEDGYYHLLKDETTLSSTQLNLPFEPHLSRIIDEEKSLHVSKGGNILFHTPQRFYRCSVREEFLNLFSFEDLSLLVARDGSTYTYDYKTHILNKSNLLVSVEKPLFRSGNSLIYTDPEGNLKIWDSMRGSHPAIGAYTPEMLHAALLKEKFFVFLSKDKQLKYSVEGRVRKLDFRLGKEEEVSGFFIANSSLWISTGDRLYQIGFYLKDENLKLLEPKVFTAEDYNIQLPVFECVGNEEGTWWLASAGQVLLYHSFALAPDISKPGLVLEKVSLKSADSILNIGLPRRDSLKINLGKEDHLFIKAFPVVYDLKNKAALMYRYSSGADQWKVSDDENLIHIAGLKPGRHILELISRNEQGVKSEKVILTLEVATDGWFNWWIITGASLSFMLAGYLGFNGLKRVKDSNSREARERYEKELLKLQKRSHEQMMKAESLKQVNQLISAQKAELEDKNKQIVAQKYELSLTNSQIKQQKDVIEQTTEKLQSSINYAQRIQSALMGDEILIKEDLPESFVLFKPRDQVSGDFFWFDKAMNEEGDEVLIIAAVDCTGHGVPGAIISVVGIQLLNAIVKAKGITEPGKILTELNSDLLTSLKYEQTRMNDGMDMGLCTINIKKKKIYFAGAKNPLFKIENGELEIFKGDRFPIGGQKLREEKDFKTHERDIRGDRGQMFYLFSDGYQDQFGGTGKSKFMAGNFKKLLLEISGKPMMEQKYILGKTIKEWQGDEEQTDDILVLGFRI